MAIDLRAKTYCNLGTIISGSFADDYLQNSGLIKTVGNVKLQGLHTPAVGTQITFAYQKNGHLTRLPRVLRVLSSFADPYRNTTDISMGCLLTYLDQLKPPPVNYEIPIGDNIAIPPVTGATLAAWVCSQVGIAHGTFPLTNTYARNSITPTSGYIALLNDLLLSESYVGYLDETETLRFINLSGGSNYGPLLSNQEVIDVSAIGIGQLPAASVIVRYNYLRFNYSSITQPSALVEKRNWEESLSYDRSEHSVPYTYLDSAGKKQNANYTYSFTNKVHTKTEYDRLDRVAKRTETRTQSLGEVNGQWVGDAITTDPKKVKYAIMPMTSITTTETVFVSDRPTDYPYCNMPAKTTSTVQEPRIAVAGTLGINSFLHPITGALADIHNGAVTTSIEEEVYDTVVPTTYQRQGPDVNTAPEDLIYNTGITQQTRASYGSSHQTAAGQQALRKSLADLEEYAASNGNVSTWNNVINSIVSKASNLSLLNSNTQVVTNREFGYETRPSLQDRTNNAFSKSIYTGNRAEIQWILGSSESTSYIEFSMPLASDDQIVGGVMNGYVVPSDAASKALRFGRAQNALLLGNRNGMNMQLPPELLPTTPFAPLYFTAQGATAQYRVNANSWTFDANGLVCSTDALFWGGITSSTDMWYPTPPSAP